MNTNIITKKRWAVAILAVVLVAILSVTLVACGTKDLSETSSGEITAEQALVYDFTAEIQNTEFIKLAMSAAVANSENGSVSKTLTATVTPATASNKLVDWSVAWGDASNVTDVSEYITVTPSGDGSTEATVTCHKPFTGVILIVCTTREGGYSAECSVEFVGLPSSISLSGSISPTSDNTLGSSYKLGVGTTYTFTVACENAFNQVGSSYNNYSFFVVGYGDLTMGELHHNNLTLRDDWHDEYSSNVNELKDQLISVSLSGNSLVVETKKSIEGYYRSSQRLDGGRNTYYYDKVKSVDSDAYFEITVIEQNSNLYEKFYLRFDDDVVTGVNLSGSLKF